MLDSIYNFIVISIMKKKILLAAALSVCATAFAQNAAVVNGEAIPSASIDKIITNSGQPDSPELRKQIRESLINEKLILQEAKKLRLSENKNVKAQLEQIRKNMMISAVVDHYLNEKDNAPTEAEVKAEYEKIKTASAGAKEYHVRHILLDKETDANSVIAKLKNGAKFEDLAKTMSKDTKSAANGGDLGWLNPEVVNPEFGRGMLALKKPGDFSEQPINTPPVGWHVIKLDEIRDFVLPPLDKIRAAVEQRVRMDPVWREGKVEAIVKLLRTKAKIQ
jgi:peptidyl-prolyl cis-trans isomerase C